MRKRKILSFILILALVFALAPLTGATKSVSAAVLDGDWITNGSPTAPADIGEDKFDGSEEGEAILITSASELAWLAQQVNGGNTFEDKHIRLTVDLDLSGHYWVPIGTGSSFGGTFYGDGHTISGLTINGTYQYAGLFGWLTTYSMTHLFVENLHIGENSSIQNNIGGGSGGTGGIAGFMNIGRISGCSNAGSIEASNSGFGGIGGIVGHADMYSIDNCWNTGNVTGHNAYVGGIVGYANGSTANSSIDNCYNTGNISSDCNDSTYYSAAAGGIIGLHDFGSTLQNCYNTGDITSTNPFSGSSALAGGIAGFQVGDVRISYCYSSGSVAAEGEDAYAGGISGANNEGLSLVPNVQNCAALNEKVVNRSTDTSSACRIGYPGTLSDNYALTTMEVTLNGVGETTTSDSGGEDGAELEANSLKGSWWSGEAWDTDVWTLPGADEYGLPILKNGGDAQSSELPGYMPIAPTIKTSSMPGGTVGVAYSQQLTASGGTPITWSVTTGTMPAGLTLSGITISGTPSTAGTYSFTIRAENAIGSVTQDYSITISPAPVVSDEPVGGRGGGTPVETPKPVTSGNTTTATTETTATVDSSGKAAANVTKDQLSAAVNSVVAEAKKQGDGVIAVVEIKVEAPANSNSVETGIPRDALGVAASSGADALIISTPVASISFDTDALTKIYGEASADVKITAGKVDASSLAEDAKQLIGDRPVFNFSVTSGNNTISQFDGNVTVSVPYMPKAGEDTDAVVIYYINFQGKPEAVANCKYDPATKTVSFTTDHFSQYAVGYNKVSFGDVKAGAWYENAVEFTAARGIVTGTGNRNFDPAGKLTRGQLLVMLMRAYGIEPDTDLLNNFSDAGNTYYTGYLAAARRLGITEGLGNNLYAPNSNITRQEMFTLLYNTLKVIGQLPEGTGKATGVLTDYSDSDSVASWAKDAAGTLADAGIIGGNNGKLSPKNTTTRAEMAQVLYNLLSK